LLQEAAQDYSSREVYTKWDLSLLVPIPGLFVTVNLAVLLAITDANLISGRLLPEYFPKIFGPHENEALDYDRTKAAFEVLTAEINESTKA
jgi:hypothetical protein